VAPHVEIHQAGRDTLRQPEESRPRRRPPRAAGVRSGRRKPSSEAGGHRGAGRNQCAWTSACWPVDEVLELVRNKPDGWNLVLTGRGARGRHRRRGGPRHGDAEVKHYYAKGVDARTGVRTVTGTEERTMYDRKRLDRTLAARRKKWEEERLAALLANLPGAAEALIPPCRTRRSGRSTPRTPSRTSTTTRTSGFPGSSRTPAGAILHVPGRLWTMRQFAG